MSDPEDPLIESGSDVERAIYFSDAVFAIAITLLALEIRIPELHDPTPRQLLEALAELLPRFSSFAISFWIVGWLWMAHHRIFHHIRGYDRRLLLINLLLLMWVALMPFSGSLLGQYGEQQTSIVVYCAHMIAASTTLSWLWLYASRDRKLVSPDIDPRVVSYTAARSLLLPLVFLLCIFISFLNVNLAEFSLLLILFVRPLATRYARLHGHT